MKIIEDFIGNLKIGKPLAFNQLIIEPVFVKKDYNLPVLTLEEALGRDVLEITEKDEGGSVPELLVKNTGKVDVIVLEGEELRGAKQNRIVNTTIIISAQSELLVPVSCVEQNRWRYVSERFSSGGNVLYPSLRKKSHDSVTSSLRQNRGHRSDQHGIWSDISRKSARLSVQSDTEAMSDILEARVTAEAEAGLISEIPYQSKQIGFLAFIGGGFAGGDVFGSTELCEKQMKKMLRGYLLDAIDEKVKFPKVDVEEILKEIARADHEQFGAVGKGVEMRFETARIQGAWSLVDNNVSHLTVFAKG